MNKSKGKGIKILFWYIQFKKISFKPISKSINNKRITKILEEIPVYELFNQSSKEIHENENRKIFFSPSDSYKIEEEVELNQENLD